MPILYTNFTLLLCWQQMIYTIAYPKVVLPNDRMKKKISFRRSKINREREREKWILNNKFFRGLCNWDEWKQPEELNKKEQCAHTPQTCAERPLCKIVQTNVLQNAHTQTQTRSHTNTILDIRSRENNNVIQQYNKFVSYRVDC